MKCINKTKGYDMRLLKKLLPWLGLSLVFITIGYLYGKNCTTPKSETSLENPPIEAPQIGKIIQEPEQGPPPVDCPAQRECPKVEPPPACPPAKVQEVIKWRDRIVYKDKIVYRDKIVYQDRYQPIPYGCHVNWETREVTARSKPGYSIECYVNYQTRKVDTYEYVKGLLRRGGPLPGGVLDDALKAYDDYVKGKL